MPAEGTAVQSKDRRGGLRALLDIVGRQSRNFHVMLRWHVAGGLIGGLAGSYLGMYPYDLGASVAEVGYLTSVNALSACVPALIGGALAQKYGRKRLVLYIWPFYIAFYVLTATATSWLYLIPAYLVYSVAYAGDPALGALYADSLDEETRAEAVSLDSTLSGILALTMPPIGAFIVEYLGGIRNPDSLRIFYGFYVVFHVLTMVYFWRWLQDDERYEEKESVREALRSINGLFTEGKVRRYLAFTIISSLSAGLSAPFVTIYIFSEVGVHPTFVGLMAAVSTGITYLALNLGAWWSDRTGRKAPIAVGYVLSASALVALAFADTTTTFFTYYILAALTAIGSAASSALVLEYVPSDLRSRYLGINEALMLLCIAAGTPVGGLIYASLGAKALFTVQAALQCFLVLPYFLLAIPETRRHGVRTPARLLRHPRIPSWLTLHPKTHH